MNPDRYGTEQEYASDFVPHGMAANVFFRVKVLESKLSQMESAIEYLKNFQEEWDGDNADNSASSAMAGVRKLMRSLDSFQYAFPELEEETWFAGFQDDVHHAYWRVEDGKFDDALSSDEEARKTLLREVDDILDNISDSIYTNPIEKVRRFLESYGEEFDPGNAPEEYRNEVFEARDLYCLGYFSTGLIVLGRAVERALLDLGRARKITSVDGFRGETNWEDARFFERTKALYEVDMPDETGKILSKSQYHQIQLLIDHRNQVAHTEYRQISKDTASRMMSQALDLLTELEECRKELEGLEDEQINEKSNVSLPL